MSRRLPVGVIGAGRIGRLHAENLARMLPASRLVVIADPRLEQAQATAVACGIERAVDDPRRVLDDPGVEAVVICSPTDTHARLIEEAAAAGKHIFCEKPLDLDLRRIARALAAVQAAGVRLQIGFNRRFDPSFRRVAGLVGEGAVGTPQLVRITSRDPQPPSLDYVRSSGGLFLDMTIHDFDMARFLVRDEVVEVYATGTSLVDPEIGRAGDIDTAVVTLRYARGGFCSIDNSRRAVYGYDQRVEVFGSGGCLTTANDTPTRVSLWNEQGQQHDRPLHFFAERYRAAYIDEMQEFVDCVLEGREPAVSGRDGYMAVALALAALRSLAERRPVTLEAT